MSSRNPSSNKKSAAIAGAGKASQKNRKLVGRATSSINQALLPLPEDRLAALRQFLDPVIGQVEVPEYIATDPVAFMHRYDETEDRNLAGFLAAIMAWGRRDIVMAKVGNLLERFGTSPADFIGNMGPADELRIEGFRHRTFTADDVRWILRALSRILKNYGAFEMFWQDCHQEALKPAGFRTGASPGTTNQHLLLSEFHNRFFELIPDAPVRVRKHLASPDKNSSCKRLWLFLRWTIRQNSCVDPGTMTFIPASELMIPLDVHVARYARMFGLLTRPANDWKALKELTFRLQLMDLSDPAKYDYALFGLGVRDIPIPDEFIVNPADG